jgi:hypothetical protein
MATSETSQASVWKYGGFCKADHRHKASDLLFVHCLSSEPTLLVPMGYRVFSFECRETHISFWIVCISEESLF